jgi:hypothetical protein
MRLVCVAKLSASACSMPDWRILSDELELL